AAVAPTSIYTLSLHGALPISADGSRPGMFYVNLRNMRDNPVYELESLAHHEGIPGHHMQIALAQELTDLPKFRKFGLRYTAYTRSEEHTSELQSLRHLVCRLL